MEARVLSTLLNEMDGIGSTIPGEDIGVIVLAATNRLEAIDSALLRKVSRIFIVTVIALTLICIQKLLMI